VVSSYGSCLKSSLTMYRELSDHHHSLRICANLCCSGQLLLCIAPGALGDGLHSVKWHPKQSDTLAVASASKIFLLELGVVARTFRGSPLPQSELNRIAQVFSVPSVRFSDPFER
jgi:hypothetical protein